MATDPHRDIPELAEEVVRGAEMTRARRSGERIEQLEAARDRLVDMCSGSLPCLVARPGEGTRECRVEAPCVNCADICEAASSRSKTNGLGELNKKAGP